MKENVIFCDFDGTITKEDTIYRFLDLFADKKWKEIEDLCIKGKIGSKECMVKQMELVEPLSEEEFGNFINDIEIDECFIDFLRFINDQKIEFYIISDGLDFFISSVLGKYSLNNIKVFSNKLILKNGKLIPSFPFYNHSCRKNSGVCKCSIIEKYKNLKKAFYIGDGVSDTCSCTKADIIFAKNYLAGYCTENQVQYIGFNNFKDIHSYFSRLLK